MEVGDGVGGEQDDVAEAGRAGGPEEVEDGGPGGRASPGEGSIGNARDTVTGRSTAEEATSSLGKSAGTCIASRCSARWRVSKSANGVIRSAKTRRGCT